MVGRFPNLLSQPDSTNFLIEGQAADLNKMVNYQMPTAHDLPIVRNQR